MNIPYSLDCYIEAYRNYADFDGRAMRSEFWWYTGYFFLFTVIFLCLDIFVLKMGIPIMSNGVKTPYGPLTMTYILINIIPSISITVRRLHDVGRSGWYYLVSLIPFGGIFLAAFQLVDSQKGENQWGPNPKGIN